jgi:tetratricopeptide (TPR) repeat protein
MENPLMESGTFSTKSRVAYRHSGHAMEPIAGQFVMDFAPSDNLVAAKVRYMRPAETAEELFLKGVALEEDPTTQAEAIECYRQALELEPEHAAAHINLGTLYYNHQDYAQAEKHYRQATTADPRYALAYFDLGNVLDETGRLPDAVRAYRQAITLAPTYADAHYNLALAYEKMAQQRKALEHWRAYVRLDTRGPWAVHARNQIQKILDSDPLQLIHRKARS